MKAEPEGFPSADDRGEKPSAPASERLRQLKQLYDEGLVSSDEYAEKRQDLLGQL